MPRGKNKLEQLTMDRGFRTRVQAVLYKLEEHGFDPFIAEAFAPWNSSEKRSGRATPRR